MVKVHSHLPVRGRLTQEQITTWLASLASHRSRQEVHQIAQAIALIQDLHFGQYSLGGVQLSLALVQTAEILEQLKMDTPTLLAALLSRSPQQAQKLGFSDEVTQMIHHLNRIQNLNLDYRLHDEEQIEKLRKLLLGIVDDVRVILLLLAQQLQIMRVLKFEPDPEQQKRIATTTLSIHAPLANRLGIWQIKWELEDLSLRFTEPETYQRIVRSLEDKRSDREKFIARVIAHLQSECQKRGIEAEITGRPKHIYSIWKKMQRKGVDFKQIFDIHAVRVLVDTIPQCYEVLGVVHTTWQPIPGEFDDYIANAKANGYQSLHTAVIGYDGRPLEVQIRTWQMHEYAERGVAAHWRYKEGKEGDEELERRIQWMRDWLNRPEPILTPLQDVEFESKRIYVLTPKGEVIELPRGATPLDFAYHIHSDIGHRCRGAKVDGQIVPLNRPLQNGQTVEILTAKQGEPKRHWLQPDYAVTQKARQKIRHWFKQQDKSSLIQEGKKIWLKQFKSEVEPKAYGFEEGDDFYAALARGEVQLRPPKRKKITKKQPHSAAIKLGNKDNLLSHIALCCKPLPGDAIIGYITRNRGISIHRQDCKTVQRWQQEQPERLLPIQWSDIQADHWVADLFVQAVDRPGLLNEITAIFSQSAINVLAVNTHSDRYGEQAHMHFSLQIRHLEELDQIMHRLQKMPGISTVRRDLPRGGDHDRLS